MKYLQRHKDTILGICATISFFMMLGTIGAVDNGNLPFGTGVTRAYTYLVFFGFSLWRLKRSQERKERIRFYENKEK